MSLSLFLRLPSPCAFSGLCLPLVFVSCFSSLGASYSVQSPDRKIQALVEDGERLTWSLKADDKTVFEKRELSLKIDGNDLGQNASVLSHEAYGDVKERKVAFDPKKAGADGYRDLTLTFQGFKLGVRVTNEAATCRWTVQDGKTRKTTVRDEAFARPFGEGQEAAVTVATIGEEHVITRGIRPEEKMWGPYQFPRPYNLGDRLLVAVHVAEDNIKSFGEPNRWFESRDQGVTWKEVDASVATQGGLLLSNGDKLYFPMENGVELKSYKEKPQKELTPGYDFSKPAEEGTLPIPDGMTAWVWGTTIKAYNADRLPPSLAKKEWLAKRIPAGKTEPVTEMVKVDWPFLTRVVHTGGILKPIFPRGTPKLGPDGAIWVAVFSGEGHLNPENGQYSPYYSAEIFRSEDQGHTFALRGHLEYEANGREYPYLSGGFSDSDFEFMLDGSMVWFLRSTWYGSTGWEWAPMYMARSTDKGKTWTKPVAFADVGILPRLCKLENGTTLLCYARPGTYVSVCANDSGTQWSEPLIVLDGSVDRSPLHNVKVEKPTFHQWDGSCSNPELIPLDKNSGLLFYSDFYYPDADGVKRKTVLCRKITVERQGPEAR